MQQSHIFKVFERQILGDVYMIKCFKYYFKAFWEVFLGSFFFRNFSGLEIQTDAKICISTLLAKLYYVSHTKLRECALGKLTVQILKICQIIPYTLKGKITARPKHRKKNLF